MRRKPTQEPELNHSARLPLNAVRVFEAVAVRGSFSEAAESLHVTTAAVSMQIKSLEGYLQTPLFRRNARDVQLTAEGQTLLPFVRRGLEELEQGFRTVKSNRAGGPLVVSLLPSYLQRWLLPRITAFNEAHPRIDLQFRASSNLADFAHDGVHAAIRLGRGGWPRLYAEELLDEWLVPVCAPTLFKRYGALRGPGDTGKYPLIHSSSEPWSMWTDEADGETRPGTPNDIWPETGITFDDSVTVMEAAVQGQGLALARWSLTASAIESGELVLAHPRAVPFARSYYFVCPESYRTLTKLVAFRDWLSAKSAEFAKNTHDRQAPRIMSRITSKSSA
jgi:LysR family transcriptional regulator, glycine cleavage system transcriptional activator